MEMKMLVLVLLGVLVFMSFVQGMQINALEGSFSGEASAKNDGYGNDAQPTYTGSVADVPAMVGGC